MAAPFDHIASNYNSLFAPSAIGQLQRKFVWNYMESVIPDLKGFEMLELTRADSEDTSCIEEGEFRMSATDISEETLKFMQKRSEAMLMKQRAGECPISADSLCQNPLGKKFDLIFSNFGNLNYLSPEALKNLFQRLPDMLNPGGRFVGVVMPRCCMWEMVFFSMRFQFRKAFRRFGPAKGLYDCFGNEVKTWFYYPRQIRRWSKAKFNVVNIRPVGLALPSSYLEAFVNFRRRWLLRLNRLEKKLCNKASFAGFADNFIFDLQLRG